MLHTERMILEDEGFELLDAFLWVIYHLRLSSSAVILSNDELLAAIVRLLKERE